MTALKKRTKKNFKQFFIRRFRVELFRRIGQCRNFTLSNDNKIQLLFRAVVVTLFDGAWYMRKFKSINYVRWQIFH